MNIRSKQSHPLHEQMQDPFETPFPSLLPKPSPSMSIPAYVSDCVAHRHGFSDCSTAHEFPDSRICLWSREWKGRVEGAWDGGFLRVQY
jgi:hypothetical protein